MMDDTDRAVAQKIKELRESTGMSQESLAAAMTRRGWPWYQQTVYRVESGTQPISAGKLASLADIFGVPPAWLFGEDGERRLADERRVMEHALREQIAAEIAGRAVAA